MGLVIMITPLCICHIRKDAYVYVSYKLHHGGIVSWLRCYMNSNQIDLTSTQHMCRFLAVWI